MSMQPTLREAAIRPAAAVERRGIPVLGATVRLTFLGDMPRPISFAKLLMTYGLSLREAHAVLNQVVSEGQATVYLCLSGDFEANLKGLGVSPVLLDGDPEVEGCDWRQMAV